MFKKLVLVSILSVVSSYASLEQFQASEYNNEQQRMVEVCMDLQLEGKLPGLTSKVDQQMFFRGNIVNLNQFEKIDYPLDMKCIVNRGEDKHSYLFRKNKKVGKWYLIKPIR